MVCMHFVLFVSYMHSFKVLHFSTKQARFWPFFSLREEQARCPLRLSIGRQHQAVDELFDADLTAVTAFSADMVHLCPDLLKRKQGA